MLCVLLVMTPEKNCDEQESWCAASQKWGPCFSLNRWFLSTLEWKNWARTYNNIPLSVFLVMSPPKKILASSNIVVQLLTNGVCFFPLTRWFLWVPECKNGARTHNDLCFFGDDPQKKPKKNLQRVGLSMHEFSQTGRVLEHVSHWLDGSYEQLHEHRLRVVAMTEDTEEAMRV